MFRLNNIGVHISRSGRALMFTWLSLLLCVYSFGLCFRDHNPDGVPAAQQACRCSACPVDCGEDSAAPGAASCSHQYGHDRIHFHKTAPVLLHQQKDVSPAKSGWNAFSPTAALTAAVSEAYSEGRQAIPLQGFIFASPTLPDQNLPLLL